jgi:hypothetical protein
MCTFIAAHVKLADHLYAHGGPFPQNLTIVKGQRLTIVKVTARGLDNELTPPATT